MKIILIAAQKGGSGKSTLARSLAVAALFDGTPTAVIDTDPQGTVSRWASRRSSPAPTVVTTANQPLPDVLSTLRAGGAALVVIDTPPHLRPLISLAAEHADAVVIPVRPSPDDLESVGGTLEIINATGRRAGIVINAAPTTRSVHGLAFARSALATFGHPVCPHEMCDRIAHQYAAAQGQSAQEYEPSGKAAAEIAAVWAWIKKEMI